MKTNQLTFRVKLKNLNEDYEEAMNRVVADVCDQYIEVHDAYYTLMGDEAILVLIGNFETSN